MVGLVTFIFSWVGCVVVGCVSEGGVVLDMCDGRRSGRVERHPAPLLSTPNAQNTKQHANKHDISAYLEEAEEDERGEKDVHHEHAREACQGRV